MATQHPSEPPWTPADDRRVDVFEKQMAQIAAQLGSDAHPDVLIVAFAKTLASLMRDRLATDPSRWLSYVCTINRLAEYIAAMKPAPIGEDEVRH